MKVEPTLVSNDRAEVNRLGKWLIVRFPKPQIMLSWAIVRGGKVRGQTVAWYQVTSQDLNPQVEPRDFLKEKLSQASMPNAVGLLTSGDLNYYVDIEKTDGEYSVRCVATVGLSNALRVGDPPSILNHVGTINLVCQVSHSLSDEALIEAVSIAAEARTAAVLETRVPSKRSASPSTGTGTDCIVMAAPESNGQIRYVGKHTVIGHLIGSSVLEAVRSGIDLWKSRY